MKLYEIAGEYLELEKTLDDEEMDAQEREGKEYDQRRNKAGRKAATV